jgi:hypothetical protein
MDTGKYNENVPESEYRYEVVVEDGGEIKAVRADEILEVGQLSDLLDFLGETYVDERGVEIDVETVVRNLTIPRLTGDKLGSAGHSVPEGHVLTERMQVFVSAVKLSLEYGFERRINNNPN